MAVKIDKNGKVIIETNIECYDGDEIVNRMEALIGVVQNSDKDVILDQEKYFALEMLRDLLPTNEQIDQYLKPKNKNYKP